MGKWHANTYQIYGNIWAFLCVAERSFGLQGIFSVPLPIFFDPGASADARTCFSLLTALTCSVTMLLAVYPQKPAPESGTFTHAFSLCAYCFAPNRIIRATDFRLLGEPGAGAATTERSGTCVEPSQAKPHSHLRAGGLSNDDGDVPY